MANIKSAMKRIDVTEKKTAENRVLKSKISTYVKNFKALVEAKDFDCAEKQLSATIALIDSSCIYHANSASRKKASLSKMLSDAKSAK